MKLVVGQVIKVWSSYTLLSLFVLYPAFTVHHAGHSQDILGTPLDYAKVEKNTADAKLEPGDIKIVIAIIAFFITNAAKNNVDADTLSEELQQLGLPKGVSRTVPFVNPSITCANSCGGHRTRCWGMQELWQRSRSSASGFANTVPSSCQPSGVPWLSALSLNFYLHCEFL